MPTGVHPHGTANRTGDPHRPFQPGQPGRRRPTGQYGKADRRPRPNLHAVDGQLLESFVQRHHQAGESTVGHQEVGAPAEDKHGNWHPVDRPGHLHQVIFVGRLDQECRCPSHPIGGAHAQGGIPLGPVPKRFSNATQVVGDGRHRPPTIPGCPGVRRGAT